MASVTIIYGTCGGNTELVCEWVARVLKKKHQVNLLRAVYAKAEDLTASDFLILATPTYGHGDLERQIERFLKRVGDQPLNGQASTVIGLGDIKYEPDFFMQGAKTLQRYLVKNGAKIIGNPLIISESPVDKLSDQVESWSAQLSDSLSKEALK